MRISSGYHPQALTFTRVKEPNLIRDLGVKLGLCEPTEEASLNSEVFCQRYCQEVQQLVPTQVAPANVEQAFQMALGALPPLQAAALAGRVAQAMVSPEAELRAAEALRTRTHAGLTRQVESGCQQAGLPIPSKVWVIQSEELDACATFGGVAVSSSYLDPSRQARLHFVVGHELSHGRNRDDIAMMGFEALEQAVSQPLLSYALKQDLRSLHHQMELRSDQDGWAYARAQQVDPSELRYQVAELLDQQQESDTHPSGRQRLHALNRA
ncbi:M48 family metalloprotease [bacterium]|nr:M48 family metalloprotease [bacterium]